MSDSRLRKVIEALAARGDNTKRMECMWLAPSLLEELCGRLIDPAKTVLETAKWLAEQGPQMPCKSSVDRFADVFF